MKPIIFQLVVAKGIVDTNCYVCACPETRVAAIIDPGAFNEREVTAILDTLADNKLTATTILNTHGHFDHVAGDLAIRRATGARLLIHQLDAPLLGSDALNGAAMMGFSFKPVAPDGFLDEGLILSLGRTTLTVLHTPGHTPGGVSLAGEGVLFSGDTLFAASIGRTDLPGGSEQVEIKSIREKLLVLPDDTVVRPGHGPRTTIGREKVANPYLRDENC
ncbi:MAG TPA: MBL fold metallo-hydrolase [Candidatus Edwardsbacteria bacterium]|nr:MBL fold metallo-hydrolase [Candidatus Edwardsbacteria bacterium]